MRHRRLAMLMLAALTAALTVQACSSTSGSSGGQNCGKNGNPDFSGRTITVQGWGGAAAEAIHKAYHVPFEENTCAKIKVVEVTGQTPALLKAAHDAGEAKFDMIDAWGSPAIFQMANDDLLAPVDPAKVPGLAGLVPGADSGVGVGHLLSVMVAGYLQKGDVKPLTSVADFFNVKDFPGRRAVSNWGDNERNVAAALLADGVPRDKLYPMDMDRSKKVWDRVKGSVRLWYQSGSELVSAMVDERIDYCLCWDGRAQQAMAKNPKWTYTLEGGYLGFENMAMVNGTKNADVVQALLEYFTDPERQAVFYQNFQVTPTNPKFIDHLPAGFMTPEKLKFVPTTDENKGKWWTPTLDELKGIAKVKTDLEEKWATWISS